MDHVIKFHGNSRTNALLERTRDINILKTITVSLEWLAFVFTNLIEKEEELILFIANLVSVVY